MLTMIGGIYQEYKKDSEGINIGPRGQRYYQKITEEYDFLQAEPVIGLNFFDIFKALFTISGKEHKFENRKVILQKKISDEIGSLHLDQVLYKHWENERGVKFKWEEILGHFGFGTEYLIERKIISQFYAEVFGFNTTQPRKGNVQLRLNMIRTPDIININNSNKFIPGGELKFLMGSKIEKIEIQEKKDKSGIVLKNSGYFSLKYNKYDDLALFRNSLNKFGVEFGWIINFG